jgi:hypothetical protein
VIITKSCRDAPHLDYSEIVPFRIAAAQLYLQARQSVTPHPISECNGIIIDGLVSREIGVVKRIEAADKVPGGQHVLSRCEKLTRKPAGERDFGIREKVREVALKVGRLICLINRYILQ